MSKGDIHNEPRGLCNCAVAAAKICGTELAVALFSTPRACTSVGVRATGSGAGMADVNAAKARVATMDKLAKKNIVKDDTGE